MSNREPGYHANDDFGPHPHDQWAAQRAAQPKKKGGCLKIGGIAALALIVAVGVGTCATAGGGDDGSASGSSSTSATTPDAPPIEVTAQQMIDDLEANALGASNTYKGKRVKVTGQVSNIDAQGDYFSIDGGEITFTSIMCRIKGDELTGIVAGLSDDQPVVVTGTVTGVGEVMGYTMQTETVEVL